MAINNKIIVAAAVAAAGLGGAFAFGFFSADEGTSAGLSETDAPVITVYKSPT